jgi:hypothetical protein
MAVLLDLGGQGGTAGHVAGRIDGLEHLLQHGLAEPVPFHRRVALGVIGVQQLPVLDEQQGIGHHRRHVVEIRVGVSRMLHAMQSLAPAIEQIQAGDGFFLVRHEQAEIIDASHVRGNAGLPGHLEALDLQPLDVVWQADVAQANVVGPAFGVRISAFSPASSWYVRRLP